MYEKLTKCPNFTRFLPEKKYQNTRIFIFARKHKFQILHDFCPKNVRILHNNIIARKNTFSRILGGHVLSLSLSPTPICMIETPYSTRHVGYCMPTPKGKGGHVGPPYLGHGGSWDLHKFA